MTLRRAAALAFFLALSGGCSADRSHEEVCEDYVDAVVEVGSRCGNDRDAVRASLTTDQGFACSDVVLIRDEPALYDDCLPYVRGLTCEAFFDGPMPDRCKDQLLY